jgi:hypothetical protein
LSDATYNVNGAFLPTTKRRADMDGPDFYPTPRWATRALLCHELFTTDIWEPACGNGEMTKELQLAGKRVWSSDLYDHGFGDTGRDFLKSHEMYDNIVTNPPYNCAEAFVHHGLYHARDKLALLLRLAFLEGANRANTIFQITPPSRVWVFSERVTFYRHNAEIKGSGTTAYAWFVWDRAAERGKTELKWFTPGYKAQCGNYSYSWLRETNS